MVIYGKPGHSWSAKPHARKPTRYGSDGMKGYSRYASSGKGLTDVATITHATRLSMKYGGKSKYLRDYVTFINRSGERLAIGSFQILGMSAAGMGFGTGMLGYAVTGDTGLTGYEFAAKYVSIGESETGETLYVPREKARVPKPRRVGMVGLKTVEQGAPGTGIGRAAMGGMNDWQKPQMKKVEKEGGRGIGTVIALGGVGYILWSLLK